MNSYYVYCLTDPRNNLPFYIGKGKGKRMYSHERDVKNGKIPNTNNTYLFWKIKKILKLGLHIIYNKMAENLDDSSALLREMEEIRRIGRHDLHLGTLCNLTDGGEGNSGKVVSEASKRKMSMTAKERLKDPSKHPMFHKHHSQESKNKMSVSGKLRFSSPEERERTAETTRRGMFSSGYVDRVSKSITLKSPTQKIIIAKNISKFCRENNLENANVYKLLSGEIKQHKGWTLPNTIINKPEYCVINSAGRVYTVTNIESFCREHNLIGTNFRRLLRGESLTHKGFIKYVELNGNSPGEYVRNIKHSIYSKSNKLNRQRTS